MLEYVRERFDTLERHLSEQLASQQKILDKVETGLTKRLDQIRAEMNVFCSRESVEALELRIRYLENVKADLYGRLAMLGGIYGVVIVLINWFIRARFG